MNSFNFLSIYLNTNNVLGIEREFYNRVFMSSFILFVGFFLSYFFLISRKKIKANDKNKDGKGLQFLCIAYALYFALIILSVLNPVTFHYDAAPFGFNIIVPSSYLLIDTGISACFLLSLGFFSINTHNIDKFVNSTVWIQGVKIFIGLYVLFILLCYSRTGVSLIYDKAVININKYLAVFSYGIVGLFIIRYYFRRKLKLLGVFCIIFFSGLIYIMSFEPSDISEGKFVHVISLIITPSLAIAVILLTYTFNWINELNFYELSSIWVGSGGDSDQTNKQSYGKLTTPKGSKEDWLIKIANDDIEKVIEEMIILKKYRNENLENILNIASRNTRNNNSKMKEIISYDEYQLSRNKVQDTLLTLVRRY